MSVDALAAERTEQTVWARLWDNVDDSSRAQLGIARHRFLDAEGIMTAAVPDWFFNRVIGLGMDTGVTEQELDALIAVYHDRKLPVGISLSPQSRTPQLAEWLRQRGFTIANEWVKMVRGTAPPPEINCPLRIEPAGADQQALVADIIATGFGLDDSLRPLFAGLTGIDDNHVYIAWDGDTPAAAGILAVHEGIGHLNTAATLPDYRGRGAQGAIMARRLRDGIALGCRGFVTETWVPGDAPNHSYNNMQRHGFELLYRRPNWAG